MPLYEFYCPSCDKGFEELVRSADDISSVACPTCDGGRVERRISVFSARSAGAPHDRSRPAGGCGRCGDPDGPCGLM